jgi:hypothetical protein
MNKLFLIIVYTLVANAIFSQDSVVNRLTKFRFDLQLFGNSPIFSAGLSKSFLVGKKCLLEARLGAGFYFEFKDNQYPTIDGRSFYEKNTLEPAYSIPLELTYMPNYQKKISFSIGVAYNFFYASSIYADPVTFKFTSYRGFSDRMFFSAGADYIIKKRLYLGIRLLSPYDFEKGFAYPFTAPFPSIRYKF